MDIVISDVIEKRDYALCVQIRTIVFVVGQSVPLEREVDEFENDCHFYLAPRQERAIGTVRWRRYKAGSAKIERLAVLENARGMKVGQKLMQHIEREISQTLEVEMMVLHSQDNAIAFYNAIGSEVVGDGFLDANIPHHSMKKRCLR